MPEQYQSALTGPQMDQALLDMANHTSERYAKGTANGAAVPSGTVGYHDNALYYKDLAANQAQAATNAAGNANAAAAQAEDAANRAESAIPAGSVAAVLYDRAQTLTEAQKLIARTNIGAGTGSGGGGNNPNILDNAWWTINQKGDTSGNFVAKKGVIDRWNTNNAGITSGTWSLSNKILTLTAPSNAIVYWEQAFITPGEFDGRVLTASIRLADNTIYSGTITRVNGTAQTFIASSETGGVFGMAMTADNVFRIGIVQGQSVSIKAVKMEYGNISTLENDGPPDHQMELEKCRLYFKRLKPLTSSGMQLGPALNVTATVATLYAWLGRFVAMPTATYSGTFAVKTSSGDKVPSAISVSAVSPYNNGCININFTVSSLTVNELSRIFFGSTAYIDFSAEP